jgi:hypothetical protein
MDTIYEYDYLSGLLTIFDIHFTIYNYIYIVLNIKSVFNMLFKYQYLISILGEMFI